MAKLLAACTCHQGHLGRSQVSVPYTDCSLGRRNITLMYLQTLASWCMSELAWGLVSGVCVQLTHVRSCHTVCCTKPYVAPNRMLRQTVCCTRPCVAPNSVPMDCCRTGLYGQYFREALMASMLTIGVDRACSACDWVAALLKYFFVLRLAPQNAYVSKCVLHQLYVLLHSLCSQAGP